MFEKSITEYTVFDGETELGILKKESERYAPKKGYSRARAKYHKEADENSGTSEVRPDKYGRLNLKSYKQKNETVCF